MKPLWIRLRLAACLLPLLAPPPAASAQTTVKASDSPAQITMDNGILAVTADKKRATLTSIRFRHGDQETEMCLSLYFDSNGGAKSVPAGTTVPRAEYEPLSHYASSVRLARNTPDVADLVLSGGPTVLFPFVTEIHYVLRRGESGLYAYVLFRHEKDMAAASLGQTRFVLRGPPGTQVYTNHIVDDQRKGPYPTSPSVKTVSDATFLLQDGSVYTKYNNTAFMANHHVHGMAGHGVGAWMINASNEYVNGGPVKQELTVHEDNTLLNMLQGGHFGSGDVQVAQGEAWRKLYGPFLVYFNHGASVDQMYDDAKRRATGEEAAWPYGWVDSAEYPVRRGVVSGRLRLTDGKSAKGAWVVLAAPGGDWPLQGKGYIFWTQTDAAGRFTITKVLPGSYTLYAYGADQFEQYARDGVVVEADKALDLGALEWKPVTHGRMLWQIGVADRSSQEFHAGDDVRHWANFLRYPKEFPEDVTFIIGRSHERTDWNYAQWTWYSRKPYWTIRWEQSAPLSGTATLTLGFAASNPVRGRQTNLEVKVNGTLVSVVHLPKSGAAMYRSGGQDSLYQVRYVTFDASLLHAGTNEITLGHREAAPFPSREEQMQGRVGAVIYDAIRLEVAEK